MSSLKKCRTCLVFKDLNEYLFRKDRNKYINDCKLCNQIRINKYRRENEEYKKRYNEYRKNKRLNDDIYAIKERLRARVRKMLKSKNNTKYFKTFELLGCDFETFKQYIIKQFYGDMDWDKKNFELDHKIPCSWFDLSNPKHQKICFNYKNIQPLTYKDNSKKRDRIWIDYNLQKNPYI